MADPTQAMTQPMLQDPMVDAINKSFERVDINNQFNAIQQQDDSQQMDAFFAEQDRKNSEWVRRNLGLAAMNDPDREAEIDRLTKATGMSRELISADIEQVRRMATLQSLNAEALSSRSPVLARQLRDPAFAALAYDDLDPLSNLEAIAQPFRSLAAGIPSISGSIYQTVAAPFGLVSEASKALDRAFGGSGEGFDPAGDVEKQLRRLAEGQYALADIAQGDMRRFGQTGQAFYGGLRSVTEQAPGIVGFLLTGNPAYLYRTAGVTAGGSSINRALNEGMPYSSAVPYGFGDAAIEVVTERIPALRLFSDLKAGSPFVKTLLDQYATEIPQEQLATFLQDFNAWGVLPSNQNKTVGDFLAERPAAAYETLIATLTAVSVQTGATYGGNRLLQKYSQSGFDPAQAKAYQDALRAVIGQRNADMLSKVGEAVEASKLNGRSPEKMAEYLSALFQENIENGDMPESVLIDAQDLIAYGRENNVDVRTISEAIAKQIDEAVVGGGMVAIPTQEYIRDIAATQHKALNDVARLHEESMNGREAQTWIQDQASRFREEADRIIQQNADNAELQASAQEVFDLVKREIIQSGRHSEDAANQYAALHRAFAVTMADRLGMKPSEVYAKYGLRVRSDLTESDDSEGTRFDQATFDQTETPAFKKWSGEAPVIRGDQAEEHAFQSGAPVALEAFHGTARGDRVGATFKRSRATSGPMSFFTSSAELASGYAKGKQDTSLGYEDASYENWFKYQPKGERTPVDIIRAWYRLDAQTKTTIRERAPHIRRDDEGEIVVDPENMDGNGSYTYNLQVSARRDRWGGGNPLEAMVEDWLNSGVLFNDEERFMEVLKLAGFPVKDVTFDDPHASFPFVYKTYIRMQSPLVTSDIPQNVVDALNEKAKRDRTRPKNGVDLWDKNARTLRGWVEALNNGDSYVWTSIPDKVTKVLTELGYDGIIDYSGKGGGQVSPVYIPFTEYQVKSAIGNKGTFKETKNILNQGKRGFINFPADFANGPSIITLLENANASTFIHESGHFFFEVMRDMASDEAAPQSIKKDMAALLKFVGVDSLDAWNALSIEQRREGHEKVARAFEAYLFEGKSPNLEMASIFRTLARWLRRVYESLKELNVELSDSVRSVFDRMLATEDQILAAAEARSMAPIFESQAQSGMSDSTWKNYQTLTGDWVLEAEEELQGRDLRNLRWQRNQRDKLLKKMQAENAEKIKEVRAEITNEVRRMPVYAARRFLSHGEVAVEVQGREQRRLLTEIGMTGHKIAIPALVELYGDGPAARWRYLPVGRYGLVAKEGLHPDFVAKTFGFTSGDHLIQELLSAQKESELVDDLTEQRVLERYGDLQDMDTMNEAVDLALHNEVRTRAIHAEMKALAKMTGRQDVLSSAARNFAEEKIGEKRIRDIKPGEYSASEARAARAAQQARAAGDLSRAADEKRRQVVQHYFYKSANRASTEVEKILRYLKRFDSKTMRSRIDIEYLDQIDQLLESIDLRKSITNKQLDSRESLLAWMQRQQEQGLEPDIDADVLQQASKKHYRNMTLNELRNVADAISNIHHLGKLKKTLLTAKDKRNLLAVINDMVAAIQANAKRTLDPKIETRLPKDRALQLWGSFLASHRKFASVVREMDGGKDGGVLWEYLIRPLNEAADREAVMREEATVALYELLDAFYSSADLAKMYSEQYVPGLKKSITHMGRLMVAMNMGNKDNRQRLMDGRKWTEEQIGEILSTLDKRDWDFVQGVLDHIDSYWTQIKDKERRVSGVEPQKVEALPIQTKFGEYRGGYFPIKYDDRVSTRAYANIIEEVQKQMSKGAFTRATTRRGHTEARKQNVNMPLRFDFGVIFEHLDQVIHDLSFHEYLIDVNRLLGHEEVKNAILIHYGMEVYQQLQNTVRDVAAGDAQSVKAYERVIDWLRSGVSIAAMGWNLGTALLQPFGLTQGVVRVGAKYVGRGLSRWFRNADSVEGTVAWIHSVSPMMRLRAKTMQREINEIRNKVEVTRRRLILGKAEDSYFWLIAKAQMVADVPIWLGAYEKAMDDGYDEEKAIKLADQAVLDSQGGGQIKDLAGIQRGGPLMKLWTNFYSFFNTTWNLTAESYNQTNFRSPEEVGRFAVDMLMLYTIPATFAWIIRDVLLRGECDRGTDLGCLAEGIVRENLSYMSGTLVGLREMGSAFQGYYGYSGPAGVRGFNEVARLVGQLMQGEMDAPLVKALNSTAGIFLHYPAGQVQHTAEGFMTIVQGGSVNPLSLLFGPPKD